MENEIILIDGKEYTKIILLQSSELMQRCLAIQKVMGSCTIELLFHQSKVYIVSVGKPSVIELTNAEAIFQFESIQDDRPNYMG